MFKLPKNRRSALAPLLLLHEAYDTLNQRLFEGALPGSEMTFTTRAGSDGHFKAGTLVDEAGRSLDQIAVNASLPPSEMLQSLAHQACHQYRQYRGAPPRRAYHDHAWAAKMVEIGLQPSSTGKPGGQVTGQRMAHYLIEGGRLDELIGELVASGFNITLAAQATSGLGAGLQPQGRRPWTRTKYACAGCNKAVLGGDRLNVICGDCNLPFLRSSEVEGPLPVYGNDGAGAQPAVATA